MPLGTEQCWHLVFYRYDLLMAKKQFLAMKGYLVQDLSSCHRELKTGKMHKTTFRYGLQMTEGCDC